MTTHGLVSVVERRGTPRLVLVRARDRSHLAATLAAGGIAPRIRRTPEADYPFRAVVRKDKWARAVARLARGIDYANFKSEAGAVHGENSAYAKFLRATWEGSFNLEVNPPVMREIMEEPGILGTRTNDR
jgi:hypothetical protein